MSKSETKGSGLSVLDTALVVAAVVGGIFVVLWMAHAVLGAGPLRLQDSSSWSWWWR